MRFSKLFALCTTVLLSACQSNAPRGPASVPSHQKSQSSDSAAMDVLDLPNSCLQKLPPGSLVLLKAANDLRQQVEAKQLSMDVAGQILNAEISKSTQGRDKDAAIIRALIAAEQDKITIQQNFGLLAKLANEEKLSPDEFKKLAATLRLAGVDDAKANLEAIALKTKAPLKTVIAAGAKLNSKGWDFSNFDGNRLLADTALVQAMEVFFPGIGAQLKQRDSKKSHNVYFGDWILLPHNRLIATDKYKKELATWFDEFETALNSYQKSAHEAASYSDLMRGGAHVRHPWWGNPDLQTAAQIEKDGSYKRALKALEILQTKLGVESSDLKPFYRVLSETINRDTAALDEGIKKLKEARQAFFIAPFLVIPGLNKAIGQRYLAGVSGSLIFGLAHSAISSGISSRWKKEDYLCNLIDNLGSQLPANVKWSPLMGLLGLVTPQGLAATGQAFGKEFSLQSSAQVSKWIAAALGVPATTWTLSSAFGAKRYHQAVKEAEAQGLFDIANQYREKRDQELLHAIEGLGAIGGSAALWRLGSLQSRIPPHTIVDQYSALGTNKVKTYGTSESFHNDLTKYISLRERVEGVNLGSFKKWLFSRAGRDYSDALTAQTNATSDLTLAQHVDLAILRRFELSGRHVSVSEMLGPMKSPRYVIMGIGGLAWSLASKIGNSVVDSIVLAPSMRLVNSYTDAPIVPWEAYLKQLGNQHFGKIATASQEWIIRQSGTRSALSAMQKDLERFRRIQMGKLDTEEQKGVWEDFQSVFYQRYLTFNQAMPGNMREGRHIWADMELFTPLDLGDKMSERMEKIFNYSDKIQTLVEKEKAGTLSQQEKERLEEYNQMLDIEKNQLAATLALFKIRQFIFGRDNKFLTPDLQIPADQIKRIESISDRFMQVLGYPYFFNKVVERMDEQFKGYETIFNFIDAQTAWEVKKVAEKNGVQLNPPPQDPAKKVP